MSDYDVIEIPLSIEMADTEIPLQAEEAEEKVINDYQALRNKPSINGTELVDNYNETDPTVPAWAKNEEPQKMGMAEIYDMWQHVFS